MATMKLGALADTLIGKSGNTVYYRSPAGVSFRDFQVPENPKSAAQQQVRKGFKFASAEWNQLSPQQAQAWRDYAQTLAAREPGTGAITAPRARSVFIGLAAKLRQVSPQAPIPHDPPPGRFFGDSMIVSVWQETEGAIVFEADDPNRPGIVTELLWQRLRLACSPAYPKAYRTQGFVEFESEPVALEASPGWYAVAYRFVNVATGQATELAPLGMVEVVAPQVKKKAARKKPKTASIANKN